MKFKLFMLSLLSLSVCSYVYSADNQREDRKPNTKLALLAVAATAFATYKLMPVELLWKLIPSFPKEGPMVKTYYTSNNPIPSGFSGYASLTWALSIFGKIVKKQELSNQLYSWADMEQLNFQFKLLKGLVSLAAGYTAYQLVK